MARTVAATRTETKRAPPRVGAAAPTHTPAVPDELGMLAPMLGLAAGLAYVVAAILVIRSDRSAPGSWISFAGLPSRLATFPVAALTEAFGHRLDHRSWWQMTIAVAGTAGLLGLLVAFVAHVFGA
jgi:hypothetical protein